MTAGYRSSVCTPKAAAAAHDVAVAADNPRTAPAAVLDFRAWTSCSTQVIAAQRLLPECQSHKYTLRIFLTIPKICV
jgi:hypothetical protein